MKTKSAAIFNGLFVAILNIGLYHRSPLDIAGNATFLGLLLFVFLVPYDRLMWWLERPKAIAVSTPEPYRSLGDFSHTMKERIQAHRDLWWVMVRMRLLMLQTAFITMIVYAIIFAVYRRFK